MRCKSTYLATLLVAFGLAYTPLYATVTILAITRSLVSPQPLGTVVTWTVTATDTAQGPLAFQFNNAQGKAPFRLAWDFDLGRQTAGTWTSRSFVWTAIDGEGQYQIQVVAKDFATGESATQTAGFAFTPLTSAGQIVVHETANPLVALFSAPSCPAGSYMRVAFGANAGSQTYTNWASCHPPLTMNFYVSGMRASTTYGMTYQVSTNNKITDGPTSVAFTAGPIPSTVTLPTFNVVMPAAPNEGDLILHSITANGGGGSFVPVATDLNGNVTWYYGSGDEPLLTRPVSGGYLLTLQNGVAWNPAFNLTQYVREIDLAGNVRRETNTGIISQQLLAMGVTDATPCNQIPKPPQVGNACLNHFHHEAVRLPNGYTAVLARLEKLFPPGTQGSTTGKPVDVIGDMAIVLDTNWQVVWYFDEYQQLDINRAAPLNETCTNGAKGGPGWCRMILALANVANDWTHTNAIYYITASGDLLISMRDQDWLLKVNYSNGNGDGSVIWRMGPVDGDFTFNNIYQEPYPWFSHQHDAEYQSNGYLTLFDNGNTRVAPPPLGLGAGYSRGMALMVDENSKQVTPELSQSLQIYSPAVGSAALLANGNYFFQPGLPISDDMQYQPAANTDTGTLVYSLTSSTYSYRAWQMPSLYAAPTN